MNEKVALLPKRDRSGWHPEPSTHRPITVKRTWSRWRCARGYRIHRARFATIFRDGWMHSFGDDQRKYRTLSPARLVIHFWCGQVGHNPIPFREECAEGTSPCARCEGLYNTALLDGAR